MSIQVSIVKGHYRGEPVSGVFGLVKPYQEGARGGFVTVRNPDPKPGHPPVQRIQVEQGNFQLLDAAGEELGSHVVIDTELTNGQMAVTTNYEQAFMQAETDEEAMDRIEETFAMLDRITNDSAKGNIRGLVVVGPPGVGKSFGVEKQLETANMFRTMAGREPRYEIITGGVSAIGLYQKLYNCRHPEFVVVFDDCDGVLFEEESLLLLKGALNSGDKRTISWNKESRTLENSEIPNSFQFDGSVIFLSNIDFEKTIEKGKDSRIAKHLEAIISRSHYLDLEMSTTRDKLLRIRQVVRDGMLDRYEFSEDQKQAIVDYIFANHEYLRELSLRMVKKIADFVSSDPTDWQPLVEATCLKREAKFKRLLERKQEEARRRGVELLTA